MTRDINFLPDLTMQRENRSGKNKMWTTEEIDSSRSKLPRQNVRKRRLLLKMGSWSWWPCWHVDHGLVSSLPGQWTSPPRWTRWEKHSFILFSILAQLIIDLHVNVFLEHLIAFNFLQSSLIPFNLSLIATDGNIYIQFTPFANSLLRNCKSENFSIWRICHWISLLPPNLWVTSTPACATPMAHQQIYWGI